MEELHSLELSAKLGIPFAFILTMRERT